MNKQNPGKTFWFLTLTILVAITGLWLGCMAFPAQAVSAKAEQHGLVATPQNLKYLGLYFTAASAAESQAQGVISRQQAIAAVLKDNTRFKAATSTSAMLGFLRDINPQYIDNQLGNTGLVWIVTFDGIDTPSMGPPEAPHATAHEMNVVIDAKTGKYIRAFPIFDDITSGAPENNPIPTLDATITEIAPLSPPSDNGIPGIAPTAAP